MDYKQSELYEVDRANLEADLLAFFRRLSGSSEITEAHLYNGFVFYICLDSAELADLSNSYLLKTEIPSSRWQDDLNNLLTRLFRARFPGLNFQPCAYKSSSRDDNEKFMALSLLATLVFCVYIEVLRFDRTSCQTFSRDLNLNPGLAAVCRQMVIDTLTAASQYACQVPQRCLGTQIELSGFKNLSPPKLSEGLQLKEVFKVLLDENTILRNETEVLIKEKERLAESRLNARQDVASNEEILRLMVHEATAWEEASAEQARRVDKLLAENKRLSRELSRQNFLSEAINYYRATKDTLERQLRSYKRQLESAEKKLEQISRPAKKNPWDLLSPFKASGKNFSTHDEQIAQSESFFGRKNVAIFDTEKLAGLKESKGLEERTRRSYSTPCYAVPDEKQQAFQLTRTLYAELENCFKVIYDAGLLQYLKK